MEEGTERKQVMGEEYLRVRVDLPSFQLDITTRDPKTALPELRRILEVMHADDEVMYEEFVTQELRSSFSEAFVQNERIMEVVRRLLKQEEEYRIAAASIPAAVIDAPDGGKRVTIDRRDVRQAVGMVVSAVPKELVRHAVIHVRGDLDRDAKILILDHVHKHVPTAQLRAFHSPSGDGKVRLECLFFGEFPDQDDDA